MLLAPHPGFRIVGETGTGDETLEQIRGERPDIVFLDISMPGRTGVQVAQELLDEPRAPAVVFVTAHDEFAVQAFEVSAIDYLVKPIDLDAIRELIESLPRNSP